MPLITYIEHDERAYEVHVQSGHTVMQGAVENMVDGIVAECGGACACATCHCYIDEAWVDRVGPPGKIEQEMIEYTTEPGPTSRLSCQVTVTDELDGLIVRLPKSQY